MSNDPGPNKDKLIHGMTWDEFLDWMEEHWEPGQHVAIICPTGEGKTTFAIPLLKLRKWVIALDPKGEDDTLSKSGFTRVTSLPLPRKMRNEIAEGKPASIIIGGSARTDSELAALKQLMSDAIKMVREHGGWTLYADEFQILSDREMFNLGKAIEKLQIAARKDKTSVVVAFQAAAWVPKSSTRQCRFAVIGPTRDRAMIKSVAESMGRSWQDVAVIIDQVPKFHFLVIPRDVRAPIMLVNPPEI